jgi:hypothetical protein
MANLGCVYHPIDCSLVAQRRQHNLVRILHFYLEWNFLPVNPLISDLLPGSTTVELCASLEVTRDPLFLFQVEFDWPEIHSVILTRMQQDESSPLPYWNTAVE